MSKAPKTAITPTRAEDYPEWYQQVVRAADLAENSPVRGCMVIKPWGYALWENIQQVLDRKFKATGHVNAYFPLLIPLSFMEKEAAHVEGFAKECAVVTHHRLEEMGGKLVPAGPLDEPFIIRPTSETIIGAMYAKWVQSYRDLPILINQWANVLRWEMRTRLFLRTAEFLWQEGHTAHATADEAMAETRQMLDVYADFAETFMAMPVIKGEKTPDERFPGAVNTFTIEAMMQDRKALQAGTSHFLGQNFAKASEIKFLNKDSVEEFAWTTSWGVSTRLIGGLIMTHADDDGLVLPPRLAPVHVVIMPIYRSDEERTTVLAFCQSLRAEVAALSYAGQSIIVQLDDRDIRGGDKAWQHIKKGVPIRLEVGPRDVAAGSVFMGRRDQPAKDKKGVARGEFVATVADVLTDIQSTLFKRASDFRASNSHDIGTWQDFTDLFKPETDKAFTGGFATAFWSQGDDVLAKLKELKVTARCIPLGQEPRDGKCLFSGRATTQRVVFSRSY